MNIFMAFLVFILSFIVMVPFALGTAGYLLNNPQILRFISLCLFPVGFIALALEIKNILKVKK